MRRRALRRIGTVRTSLTSLAFRCALAGAVLLTAVVVINTSGTQSASGVGPRTWWVATSGTPDGTASSCADPDAVGATHAAIQSVLDQAADDDTVHLCAGTYAVGTTLSVDEDVTIVGDGVAATILDGGSSTRIMAITSTVSPTTGATIDSIQFRNGRVTGSGVSGGAILADPAAKLTIIDSLFRGNRATDEHGGAVALIGAEPDPGSLHVVGSTFVDNSAGADGGAIDTAGVSNPDSTITNSTFVENSAGREGAAVNATFGVMRVTHSTFLDNRAPNAGATVYKTVVSNSLIASSQPSSVDLCLAPDPANELTSNVTTDASCNGSGGVVTTAADLELTFLAPWGGDTPTVAIGSGSDAIGAIAANCQLTDQRGVNRAAPCDAGAFEYVAGAATLTPNRITVVVSAGLPVANYTLPGASNLTSPTYRLATEISPDLPPGLSVAPADGRLSGTPTAMPTTSALVITASDSSGAVASMRIDLDRCTLVQDQAGVYPITSRSDLTAFGELVCGRDSDYRLTTDIAWNAAWTGVGSPTQPFSGTFDGDGHAITGLQITGANYSAFITRASDATISALTFSADVEGGYGSAGLVGYAERTNILDVHGSVTVSGLVGGSGCTGGLAGEFYESGGAIADSSVTGTIDDPLGDWVGGLVGCAWPIVVTRSSFVGAVTGRTSVGGLIGWMEDTKIIDTFAVGDVTASAQLGGLVGEQLSGGPGVDPIAVASSYASVDLNGSSITTGGLVGLGQSTALEASFWQSGLATAGALTAVGVANDLGNTPTGSAATDPADLRSHGFLHAAGWAIVDGWVDPSTTSDVWGVCDLVGRPFHLHRHATNPCVAAPAEPVVSSPEPAVPQLPSSLIGITGQATAPSGEGTSTDPDETTTTTAPTTTTVPPADDDSPTTTANPTLQVGEHAVFVDGRAVATETTWTADGSLTVRVGDAEVGLGFEPNTAVTGPLGRLRQGRPLRLRLTGLRPGSIVTATLFSTPMPLGSVTADESGVVDASLTVPDQAPAGRHRLRLEVTDREGRSIEVWAGVEVDPGSVQLPATGSSAPVVPALMLLLAGAVTLGGTRRRRHMTAG